MGNARSQPVVVKEEEIDPWWRSPPEQPKPQTTAAIVTKEEDIRIGKNDDKLDEFRQELARKRDKRRELIAEKRREMQNLTDELSKQKQENENLHRLLMEQRTETSSMEDNVALVKENEQLKRNIIELKTELSKSEVLSNKNNELRRDIAKLQEELQTVNAQVASFEKERFEYQTHVAALKDVAKVSKQMLVIREQQLTELRQKVSEIEASVSGKEINVLSEDLRKEYEKQLRNIRNLRTLYEERQRAEKKEKEKLESQLDDTKRDLENAEAKRVELEERISTLEMDNSKKYDHITSLESNLGLAKAECRQLQAEMTVINQLFSHILLGFSNGHDVDLDKLIKLLEENHDLLQDIVINEESNSSSALSKVLLDLINQINDQKEPIEEAASLDEDLTENQTMTSHQLNSPAEIVKNLPKVWKVLIELLSQHNPPTNVLIKDDEENPCYKLVQTPKGGKLVLSVSQTFIRLKDLILEKKSLEKETTRLKQLNSHLEVRLQDQEKRLELVCNELSKTWHVVGKMQKQHNHLHTQEKILRYELAQKRKLLTELKEELEYCREKWLQAREKNSTTEAQWKQLRVEFASRKTVINDDLCNSVESGYSDERESSSTDEEEPVYGETDDISEMDDNKISSPDVNTDDHEHHHQCTTDVILDVVLNEITEIENDELIHQHSSDEKTDLQEEKTNLLSEIREETDATTSTVKVDEVVSAREERLKRLEEETKQLMCKVSKTTLKSWQLDVKVENLHEKYGESSGTALKRSSIENSDDDDDDDDDDN